MSNKLNNMHKPYPMNVHEAAAGRQEATSFGRQVTGIALGAAAIAGLTAATYIGLEKDNSFHEQQYQHDLQRDGLTVRTDNDGATQAQRDAGEVKPTDVVPTPDTISVPVYDPTAGTVDRVDVPR